MPSCIVKGCSSSSSKKVGLHKLPNAKTDADRLRKWLDVTGNRKMTLEKAEWYTKTHRFVVCELHFSDDAYSNILQCRSVGGRKILNNDAVPTLNLREVALRDPSFNGPAVRESCRRRHHVSTGQITTVIHAGTSTLGRGVGKPTTATLGKRSYDTSKPDFVPSKFLYIKSETGTEDQQCTVQAVTDSQTTPSQSLGDEKLSAMLSTENQNVNRTPSTMFDPLSDQTVGCVGCFRRLLVGAVPKGLVFPSGLGVNVWCKVPESTTNIPPVASLTTAQVLEQKVFEQKNSINLCHDCFTGHMSGRKTFSLNVLGISVVTALYKEDTKYLKVEGPTKVVTLGGEFEHDYSTGGNDDVDKKAPLPPKRVRGRKILRPLTPPSDEEICGTTGTQMTEIEASKVTQRRRSRKAASPDLTNAVDYLSVGTGYLGSVEMTDDCVGYDHITIKQEPPDMSDMCILPETIGNNEYEDAPPFQEGNFIQPKVEMEDDGMSADVND